MIFSLFWEGAFTRRGAFIRGGVYFKIRDFRGAFIRGGVYSRRRVYSRKYGMSKSSPKYFVQKLLSEFLNSEIFHNVQCEQEQLLRCVVDFRSFTSGAKIVLKVVF